MDAVSHVGQPEVATFNLYLADTQKQQQQQQQQHQQLGPARMTSSR